MTARRASSTLRLRRVGAPAPARLFALVVDDDAESARRLARFLASTKVTAHVVEDSESALAAVAGGFAYAILFVERTLAGGVCGLALLAELRRGGFDAPAVLMSPPGRPGYVNDALLVDARFLYKPFEAVHVHAVVARVRARLGPSEQASVGQRRILECSERGLTRRETAEHLGLSENTLKTQTARLLVKTGDRSIKAALARRAMLARRAT